MCFLIFSKDNCLSSLALTKEEETDLAELIAEDCLYGKWFLFSFRSKPDSKSMENSLPQARFTSTF